MRLLFRYCAQDVEGGHWFRTIAQAPVAVIVNAGRPDRQSGAVVAGQGRVSTRGGRPIGRGWPIGYGD